MSSGKKLVRKTRPDGKGKEPRSKNNNCSEYLLRVEFLEGYTECITF